MTQTQLRRSALYTPGDNHAVLLKAAQSGADVLIFDLEDAVAPDRKEHARKTVAQVLAEQSFGGREVVVRVNGIGTPWCQEDLRVLARSGAAAILFPKIGRDEDVRVAEGMLGYSGVPRETQLWCMIETPGSILNAHAIGRMATRTDSRMKTWVMGTNDLVKEMRGRHTPSREPLVPLLSAALVAARAFGLCILDGVHNDIRDAAALEQSCLQGRAMGFDGKTLIHPAQIAVCHRVYSPAEEEVQQARAIIEAFERPENRGRGVIKLDGRMVELLHAEIARQTVSIADAIEAAARP